jgi:hypothetical protein
MERTLRLDEGLPRRLAGELTARGRRATPVRGPVLGDDLLRTLTDGDVLVTTDTTLPRGGRHAIAIVVARGETAKRETVHRWAHVMATQPPGSMRRYPPRRGG